MEQMFPIRSLSSAFVCWRYDAGGSHHPDQDGLLFGEQVNGRRYHPVYRRVPAISTLIPMFDRPG
jgi:hypothetical protein